MNNILDAYGAVALASVLPIIEARGAVILGVAYGLPPIWVLLLACALNFLVAFLLLLALKFFTDFFRRLSPRFNQFVDWLFTKTYHRHSKKFERWGSFALTVFVAIPLPLSGAWTGALLAHLFGIRLAHAAVLLAIGIFLSAVITLAAALGGVALLQL